MQSFLSRVSLKLYDLIIKCRDVETLKIMQFYFATCYLDLVLTLMWLSEQIAKVPTPGLWQDNHQIKQASKKSTSGKAWLAQRWHVTIQECIDSIDKLVVYSQINASSQMCKLTIESWTLSGTWKTSTCGREWINHTSIHSLQIQRLETWCLPLVSMLLKKKNSSQVAFTPCNF